MRSLAKFLFILLMAGLAWAQTNAANTTSDTSNLADEVKQLRELMVQQKRQLADQQKQLADQQQALEKLRQQLNAQPQEAAANSVDSTSNATTTGDAGLSEPRLVNARLTTPSLSTAASAQPVSAAPPQETERKESPLSFRIGGAEFTPGGFMDFTAIYRTTNVGSLGTNFFSIPFSTTQQGRLSETRFTAQNSRLSLKATEKFGENDVAGYVEMDFLGNDSTTNVFVTSNSHTLRQRLYFVDLKRHKWEVTAGQMWSWLTPNRVGVSPYTSDVFYSLDMDFNYQVGLTWARQAGVRFAYHPNDNWALGVSLEDPEQFGGQGEVTFPSAFTTTLGTEIDSATITTTPNLMPDIIPKIAYDTTVGGKHFHLEGVGLLSGFKVTNQPTTGAAFVTNSKFGGGASAAINLELFKGFHLISNAFWSDGGGRYIFGMAPDLIVVPVNAPGTICTVSGTPKAAAGCAAQLSLVHSGSGILGFEYQVTPHIMWYAYYGGMYAQRNFVPDITSTSATASFVGFGGPNSSTSNNRTVQEPSAGWIQTFWKNPQYGALQLITQASYLTRAPWFVAAGAPKNAHLFMGWADLRFVLP